jgi:hypothetical protein
MTIPHILMNFQSFFVCFLDEVLKKMASFCCLCTVIGETRDNKRECPTQPQFLENGGYRNGVSSFDSNPLYQ